MAAENGFKQVENCYVSSGQVLKLFQPSYTLFIQIRPLLLPTAS